jgi:hypothetical protein
MPRCVHTIQMGAAMSFRASLIDEGRGTTIAIRSDSIGQEVVIELGRRDARRLARQLLEQTGQKRALDAV